MPLSRICAAMQILVGREFITSADTALADARTGLSRASTVIGDEGARRRHLDDRRLRSEKRARVVHPVRRAGSDQIRGTCHAPEAITREDNLLVPSVATSTRSADHFRDQPGQCSLILLSAMWRTHKAPGNEASWDHHLRCVADESGRRFRVEG